MPLLQAAHAVQRLPTCGFPGEVLSLVGAGFAVWLARKSTVRSLSIVFFNFFLICFCNFRNTSLQFSYVSLVACIHVAATMYA